MNDRARPSSQLSEASVTIPNARPMSSRRLTIVVAASLIVGFLLPIVLAIGPASGGGESRMTGAALLGWGIGWALIATLSVGYTDHGQRWALVPAGILGLAGVALIAHDWRMSPPAGSRGPCLRVLR